MADIFDVQAAFRNLAGAIHRLHHDAPPDGETKDLIDPVVKCGENLEGLIDEIVDDARRSRAADESEAAEIRFQVDRGLETIDEMSTGAAFETVDVLGALHQGLTEKLDPVEGRLQAAYQSGVSHGLRDARRIIRMELDQVGKGAI